MNHSQVASDVVKAVGGKENITSLTHCITRLRFTLIDKEIAKKEEIESIDGVIRLIEDGVQSHVLIGNQVAFVYDEALKLINE